MIKGLLRAAYAKTPYSVRYAYGTMWRLRGSISRLRHNEAEVDRTLDSIGMFYLLGSGRCGTMILSTLLGLDTESVVLHEPFGHSDVHVRRQCKQDREFAVRYLDHYRKFEMYRRIREHPGVIRYGEVSSRPRTLGAAFAARWPQSRIFILVRNGRDTVASALNRHARLHPEMPLEGTTPYGASHPVPGDPDFERWPTMTPFERMCWWWADVYRTLLAQVPDAPVIRYEAAVGEWDYFRTMLVEPLGLEIEESAWREAVSRRSENAAEVYLSARAEEWSEVERLVFERQCGEIMAAMGYE